MQAKRWAQWTPWWPWTYLSFVVLSILSFICMKTLVHLDPRFRYFPSQISKGGMHWSNQFFLRGINLQMELPFLFTVASFNSFQLYFTNSFIIFSITRDWSRILERLVGNMAEIFYLHYIMLLKSFTSLDVILYK